MSDHAKRPLKPKTDAEDTLHHLEQAWAYYTPPDVRRDPQTPEYYTYVPLN